jgi:hypothetical protein
MRKNKMSANSPAWPGGSIIAQGRELASRGSFNPLGLASPKAVGGGTPAFAK